MRALTLQQFRGACAVVDSGFNVSRAATVLHTTQSAISKTIKGLEGELGAAIFSRSSVRMVGLTDFGQDFIGRARGILREAEIVLTLAEEDTKRTRGVLRIATTHLHARYSLPQVVRAFRTMYPAISVELEQADPDEVSRRVSSRQVQMGIAGASLEAPSGLISLCAMKLDFCIVAPPGHDLLSMEMPTIADVARYPIVAYNELHPAGARLREVFRKSGLDPEIVVTAMDASVLKEYVAAGMGIAILHKITILPEDKHRIAATDASHLIPSAEVQLIFRQGEYFRSYMYDFMQAFAPQWTRRLATEEIEKQTRASSDRLECVAR